MLVLVRITQIRGILLTDIIEINCCFSKFESCNGPLHTRVRTYFALSLAVSMCLSITLIQSFRVVKSPSKPFFNANNSAWCLSKAFSLCSGSCDVLLKQHFSQCQHLERSMFKIFVYAYTYLKMPSNKTFFRASANAGCALLSVHVEKRGTPFYVWH